MNTRISETSPLLQFILESERNLRLSQAVSASFKDARDQLIRGFCDRLGSHLIRKLKGWKFQYLYPFFKETYGALDVWKPKWRGEYRLRLEAWKHGDRMIYGIWRDEDIIGERPFTGQILTQAQKAHPSAKARKYTRLR